MQRLMIARIFMMQPNVLIADEPTSMIDACSRSTILDMLLKLRNERGMTVIQIPDLLEPDETVRALGHAIAGSLHDVRGLLQPLLIQPA